MQPQAHVMPVRRLVDAVWADMEDWVRPTPPRANRVALFALWLQAIFSVKDLHSRSGFFQIHQLIEHG